MSNPGRWPRADRMDCVVSDKVPETQGAPSQRLALKTRKRISQDAHTTVRRQVRISGVLHPSPKRTFYQGGEGRMESEKLQGSSTNSGSDSQTISLPSPSLFDRLFERELALSRTQALSLSSTLSPTCSLFRTASGQRGGYYLLHRDARLPGVEGDTPPAHTDARRLLAGVLCEGDRASASALS